MQATNGPTSSPPTATADLPPQPVIELIEPIQQGNARNAEKEAEARRQMFYEGARPGGATLSVVVDEEVDLSQFTKGLLKDLLKLDQGLRDQLHNCLSQPVEEILVLLLSLCEVYPEAKALGEFVELIQALDGPLAKKLIGVTCNALRPIRDLDHELFEYLYEQVGTISKDGTLLVLWKEYIEQYIHDPDMGKRMHEQFTQGRNSEKFIVVSLAAQILCLREAKAIAEVVLQPTVQPFFASYPNIATACAAYAIQAAHKQKLAEMIAHLRTISRESFVRLMEVGVTLYHHVEAIRSLYGYSPEQRSLLLSVLKNPDRELQRAYFDIHSDNQILRNIARLFGMPFAVFLHEVLLDFLKD